MKKNNSFFEAGKVFVLVTVTLAMLSNLGCESLPAYEKIDKLRVLAVRAAQPQIRVGDTAHIDALVVTPDNAPVQRTWQACLYTLNADHKRACHADAVVAFDTGEVFEFSLSEHDAAIMRGICEKDATMLGALPEYAVLPDCDELGFPLTVRMIATSGAESVVAIKRIWITNGETISATANPAIDGYRGLPKTVVAGEGYKFDVLASPGWIPPDFEDVASAKDALLYNWFVIGGDFKYMDEHYNDDLAPNTIFLKARSRDTRIQMWILVRDYYGGVDWQRLLFDVER